MIGKQFLSNSSLSDLVHTTLLQFCGIKIGTKMDIKVGVKIKVEMYTVLCVVLAGTD